MATYAVGDLQGCLRAFELLLATIRFEPERDRLWLAGDLVNRGPHSLGVLRRVKSLGSAAITVLGNHDLRLLAVAAGCVAARRTDTFGDVLGAPDRDELIDWLRHRPLVHHDGRRSLLVHAGALPQWSIPEIIGFGRNVEEALRGTAHREFLEDLYGTGCPQWSEALSGSDRLKTIANVLTRIRICTAEGAVAWPFSGAPAEAPAGFSPWFEVPGRRSRDHRIFFGHWSALGFRAREDIVSLDSGCVWQRHLSAVRLDDGVLFQVPCTDGAGAGRDAHGSARRNG